MVDPIVLLAFVPAALALNLTPGADMMFCLGLGLRSGPRAAVAASAGISVGGLVHVALAGLGLSALLSAYPWMFDVIRWIGVVYLLWLAVQNLRRETSEPDATPISAERAFLMGVLVNLTNPKVILFILAFVPQFVRPDAGPVLTQFLIFGVILGLGGFIINSSVGIFADGFGRRLSKGFHFVRWISSGIFATLALRLAILERA